ncbi:MAG: radical SAM protein [Bacillota bacterium]
MIRVSAGTAACFGLSNNRMDAYPTTAYLLSGNRCLMNCAFCPQGSGDGESFKKLGRITWPAYPWSAVEEVLPAAEQKGIKRICLQSVRHREGIKPLLELIGRLKGLSTLPLSLSAWISREEEGSVLFDAGVDRISISIDVVNEEAHREIKGGSLQNRLNLLLRCAEKNPGRMSTHLICGLGESEHEMLALIDKLLQAGITVALFAFTPLKGTPMENQTPPEKTSYRRIQTGHYLLQENLSSFTSFKFSDGRLVSFGDLDEELTSLLGDGDAFRTSGCPGCNRPYYNERPGQTLYNYHRPLKKEEKEKALRDLRASLSLERI